MPSKNPEVWKRARAKYKENHPGREAELGNLWRKNNPERRSANDKRSYERHKEAKQATHKLWLAANTEHVKEYRKAYGKERWETLKNTPEFQRARFNSRLKREFGITADDYDSMLESQEYVCKICRKPETRTAPSSGVARLCVDHCHTTGKVRGLLCHGCNTGIGSLRDDIDILMEAIAYLEDNS